MESFVEVLSGLVFSLDCSNSMIDNRVLSRIVERYSRAWRLTVLGSICVCQGGCT